MTVEYTVEGTNQTLTLSGELSDYPNNTAGEEVTFEFYIKGGSDPESTYQTLKEYQKYAGYSTVQNTIGSVSFYEPTNFPRSDIDSLLVKITPGSGVNQARGVWGVITDITDSTQVFGAIARLDVTVTVLADATEYDSRGAIRQQLGSFGDAEETTFEMVFESAFESAFVG